jgi:hypothetical protein
MTDITHVADLRIAINTASEVLAQVRFGCSEKWVRISKADARQLITGWKRSDTPEDHEMYSGTFGEFNSGILYLG